MNSKETEKANPFILFLILILLLGSTGYLDIARIIRDKVVPFLRTLNHPAK